MEGFKRLLRGESNIDFVGRSRTWLTITLVVMGISLGGLFIQKLNLGLEFEGGSSLTVPLATDVTVSDVEDAMTPLLGEASVQIVTDKSANTRSASVRTEITDEGKLGKAQLALATIAGQKTSDGKPDANVVSRDTVGPSWGKQVSNKALRGLIVFLILVTIYISMRFEPKMAVSALAALVHDLVATAGIYAIIGFEVTPATVIALLTLMGFSLYDTVVVFDRVRENAPTVAAGGRVTYGQMVNRSMNEVLIRSINTSISSVLPVAGLLFVGVFLLGAVTLKDLALAMFIGTLVSTYSSIFVAAPLLNWLKEREPRYRALKARASGALADAARPVRLSGDVPAVAAASDSAAASAPRAERTARPYTPGPAGAPRPRQRKRGKRR